jgi:hypothetical protein
MKGSTTLNQTDDTDWRIFVNMQNSDYEIDENFGYSTTIQYSSVTRLDSASDYQTYNVIEFDTNSTSMSVSDIKIQGRTLDAQVVGDKVQFRFTEDFIGSSYYDFEFSSNLGSTFEIEGVAYKTGLIASLTSIDTFV